MEQYKQHIFYKSELVLQRLDEFKKEVQKIASSKRKDELKGFARESTKKSIKFILDQCLEESHIKIVHRMQRPGEKEHLQILFVNNGYFAWFDLEIKHLEYFVKKYKLKKL